MAVSFVDDSGVSIDLGRELGKGGEGSVFEVAGSTSVAKIYHRPTDVSKAEKLTAMVRLRHPTLSAFAAWPERRILDRAGKQTWGVVLPRVIDHREIHHLYSPAHRKLDFPSADWSFLVHVARNCAAAFESIHAMGHVVGDVNQGGILVSRQGTIKLIDCDSFQISDGPRLFTCDVGVPHFTAPELQGKSFRGLHRAATHDAFGLAVLIFHLLYMGRHPFAGRYHGTGDMPIELAIQQGRFAYGAAAGSIQMTPPPHALRLSHVSPAVADLFERAFRSVATLRARPTAREWIAALEDLKKSLTACTRFPGHKFVSSAARSCPWCEIEKGGGPDLFISITASAKLNSKFDVTVFWREVDNIPAPKPVVTAAPVASRTNIPAPLSLGTRSWGLLTLVSAVLGVAAIVMTMAGVTVAGGWAVILAVIWVVLRTSSPYARTRRSLLADLTKASAELTRAGTEWRSVAEASAKAVSETKLALAKLRSEYQGLPQVFRKEDEELQSKKREHQMKAFLRNHFIEDASIKGIGPGRISVLRSFGIETALDVTSARVSAVDGFGPTRTAAVVGWRLSVEARFQFDPNRAIDPTERASLIQRQSQRQSALEASLAKGLAELRQLHASDGQAWAMHQRRYEAAANRHGVAASAARTLTFPTWAA